MEGNKMFGKRIRLIGSSILILTIVLVLGVNAKAEEKDPSLIGYWKMNEGEGSKIKDSSNYGNNGSIIGGGGLKLKASAGTKDTITVSKLDKAYLEDKNYFKNGTLKRTSGENRGEKRAISSFDRKTLTFTLENPFSYPIEEDDRFTISFKNSGTVWIEGIEGSCVEFDKARYINVKWKPAPKDAFTISAWIYPYGIGQYAGIAGGSWRYPMLQMRHSSLRCGITFKKADGTKWGHYFHDGKIEMDKWQYVVVTFDTTTGELKLYNNGVNIKTITNVKGETFKGKMLTSSSEYFIGSDYRNWHLFHGKIDEVKFYNRALSPEEIVNEFSALKK